MGALKKYHLSPGDRFHWLVAVSSLPPRRSGTWWLFRCDCGVTREAAASLVVNGRWNSCGCHRSDKTTKHGMWKHPVYRVWTAMVARCHNPHNPAWDYYGGRGITVCDRWRASFSDFWADMAEGYEPSLELDRIDNNQGYRPGNTRWATDAEQGRNKRSNVMIETPEGLKNVTDAARDAGLAPSTLRVRLRLGWPADKLFIKSTPRQHRKEVSRLWSREK